MKRLHRLGLLSVLVIASFVLGQIAVFAQDGPELEEYVSEDELLRLMLPAGWFADVMEDFPFPGVIAFNSEEALAKMETSENFTPGEAGLLVWVLPAEFLAFGGFPLPEDTTLEDATLTDLATGFAAVFMEPEEDATEEELAALEIGEAEEIELDDDLMAGYVTVKDLNEEGALVLRDLGEGRFAVVFTAAFPGEFTEEQAEMVKVVAASLEYDGTADELMAAFMGGAMDSGTSSTLDGAALVAERCTVCHSADRIQRADKDEAGWTATVDRMIGNGAQLSAEERDAVIEYLVGTY
ncbi:MAG: hypothetical protein JW910_15290 [Anaerolineae bacterium]|nr:hypothetical protein [Anaerolineae bacterium]